jgi:hypothetical protein
MKKSVVASVCSAVFWLFVVMPAPAYAIQIHGAPEGLYVHQIGHILFAVAMIGFALRIRKSRLGMEKAWQYMATGALLFALWNGWAFLGHILDELMPPGDFCIGSTGLQSLIVVDSSIDLLYYVFKMDHLLCIPALVYVYLALRLMTVEDTNPAVEKEKA